MTSTSFRKIILIVALIVISGNVGYQLGSRNVSLTVTPEKKVVINADQPANRDVDFKLFWDVWSRLEQKHIDRDKIDPQKMVYGAISGMVSALGDPYTVFLPPKENEDFKSDLSGTFEGIGAQLGSKEEKIVVIAPLKDHPAEKAGLLPGDWITKVNDEETFGWTVPQAVNKIRGPRGTTVTLTILHEGETETKDIKIIRDKITVKSVEYEVKTSKECRTNGCPQVGYLKLSRFGDGTNDEWNEIISKIKNQSVRQTQDKSSKFKGLILDLRNNPGGYFQSSIHVASEFLQSGVVVQQQNSDGTRETFSVTRVGSLLDMPLVVIINKGSASASEIVAGALRDHGRATLVGETTFGKGSVQTPEDLEDGSGLHITTAKWILPNGEWINGTGIKPDIEIKNPTASASATPEDLQLERAIIELLK